jgi:NOT2 / NOT3 / NOT5 family
MPCLSALSARHTAPVTGVEWQRQDVGGISPNMLWKQADLARELLHLQRREEQPIRVIMSSQVPACYLHNPPRLQPGYFAKFQQDTLFYIFYSMPGDEAQLLAADELSARQWWFHKVRRLLSHPLGRCSWPSVAGHTQALQSSCECTP